MDNKDENIIDMSIFDSVEESYLEEPTKEVRDIMEHLSQAIIVFQNTVKEVKSYPDVKIKKDNKSDSKNNSIDKSLSN